MPRDVLTCWNSTFDMVDFAIDYQTAIDAITGNHDMKMRSLELDAPEWAIAKELRDTLKVCVQISHLSSVSLNLFLRYSNTVPFSFHAIP